MPSQDVYVGATLRYPKPARPSVPILDGMPSFHYVTRDVRPGAAMVILESGINASAKTPAVDGTRRPAVLIRSSPAKAGTERTPWEDIIDVDAGELTYFGDHKPGTTGALGSTKGNKALEEVWGDYFSKDARRRLAAPPFLVFITTPWLDAKFQVRTKGAVRFLGAAVLTEITRIRAVDETSGVEYPNYKTVLRLLEPIDSGASVDWRWINARKDPSLALTDSTEYEPRAWAKWRTD